MYTCISLLMLMKIHNIFLLKHWLIVIIQIFSQLILVSQILGIEIVNAPMSGILPLLVCVEA